MASGQQIERQNDTSEALSGMPETNQLSIEAHREAYSENSTEAVKNEFQRSKADFEKHVLNELAPYHSQINKLFADFTSRKDLPPGGKIEIIDSLTKIVKGEGLEESTGILDPAKRQMLAAGIIDNLGDPHGIDQGAFPTCTTASEEEQHYTAQGGDNPEATTYIVGALKALALQGRLKGSLPYAKDRYTQLSAAELEPDWEARRDQGTDDYRNYASQLYHTVARKGTAHSAITQRFASVGPYDSSPSEKTQKLQEHLEHRSSVTITISTNSKFNQVIAGSTPFPKSVGHAANIYRQKNDAGQPEFANGEPLYFLSDQRGRNLDKKNLTRFDLQKIFEVYPFDQSFKKPLPDALSGEEARHDRYFARLKDLKEREKQMRELGEWKSKY